MLEGSLSNAVVFEVDGFDNATQLCRRLATDWFTWVESQDGYRFVTVVLGANGDDLAKLMRSVQQWAAERSCDTIRFELDGRRYGLEPSARAAA